MRPIDADALVEKSWDADTRVGYVQVVDVGSIEEAPILDVVPVVRCCQCKHSATDWTTGRFLCARNGKVVGDEVWGGFAIDKNGYCNYGEKRDLEEEK